MKITEIVSLIPKAIWSFLKATYNSIKENLVEPYNPNKFDDVLRNINVCKVCPARTNDTCRACGCNCFIKCELADDSCPIWNAEAVSCIYPPLPKGVYNTVSAEVHIVDDLHQNTAYTGRAVVSSYMYKHSYIVYKTNDGDYKTLPINYQGTDIAGNTPREETKILTVHANDIVL